MYFCENINGKMYYYEDEIGHIVRKVWSGVGVYDGQSYDIVKGKLKPSQPLEIRKIMPYRLIDIFDAKDVNDTIYVVENEVIADLLCVYGYTATCFNGFGKNDDLAYYFANARMCFLIEDGTYHMKDIEKIEERLRYFTKIANKVEVAITDNIVEMFNYTLATPIRIKEFLKKLDEMLKNTEKVTDDYKLSYLREKTHIWNNEEDLNF